MTTINTKDLEGAAMRRYVASKLGESVDVPDAIANTVPDEVQP